MLKLAITGNGSIDYSEEGQLWISEQTGHFLQSMVDRKTAVTFIDFANKGNGFLHAFDLSQTPVSVQPVSTRKGLWRLVTLARLVISLFKFDFVYIFFPGSLARIVAVLCILLRIPFALYVRGSVFGTSRLDRLVIRKAKFALTVSESIHVSLQANCQSSQLIRPMTNIKPHHFQYFQPLKQFPKRFRFLFVGRIEKAKGVFELVDSMLELQKMGIDFTTTIVGDGPDFPALKSHVTAKGLEEDIILVGQVDDFDVLIGYYRGADAFVFPTHHEGFPRVLLEAMTVGCPVFTTMVGGIPGIMKRGHNCFEIQFKIRKNC